MSNLSKSNFYLQGITDVIAIIIAYTIAFFWRFKGPISAVHGIFPRTRGYYVPEAYMVLLPAILISYILVAYFALMKENYVRRSFRTELISVTKTVALVVLIILIYLFFSRSSLLYSRAFIGMFAAVFWILALVFRVILRRAVLPILHAGKNTEQIVVVGSMEMIRKRLPKISDNDDWRVKVVGLVVTDKDMAGEYYNGIQILANRSDMIAVLEDASADSVVIVPRVVDDVIRSWAKSFHDIGKIVHVDFYHYDVIPDSTHVLDRVGSCPVISYYPLRKISIRYLFIKRMLDIILALIFMPLFFLFWLFTAIFNNVESRGPIIVSRVRVGKNGRRFNQYRFRIFRMDAEKRLQAGKNPKTIWGRFLSFSHFDRLPLIVNVLFSDMSFVGPHAPRLPRFLEYGVERRKNLCMRPGIVGRWSFEFDEDMIIRGERNYIEHWGLVKDIAILAEFVLRYLTGNLKRQYDPQQAEEEIVLIRDYFAEKEPLSYDRSLYTPKRGVRVAVYHFWKRFFDIILSLLAIIILSPLLLILMILVIGDDGGSPFYAHHRIGQNGKRIKVYKFRSMRRDAGDLQKLLTPEQLEQYQREFKIDDDPRITKIGGFLRKSSLDELPQLFNILSGNLSIVGPRPIVETETEIYGDDIAKFLSVKPGLTGYWQAYARNNATYESGERQKMELYYVDHASLGMDIKIVFKTVGSVAKGAGAQ